MQKMLNLKLRPRATKFIGPILGVEHHSPTPHGVDFGVIFALGRTVSEISAGEDFS